MRAIKRPERFLIRGSDVFKVSFGEDCSAGRELESQEVHARIKCDDTGKAVR